ncbi:spondin domain-containing protein [Actinoplanes sp. NPDC023714]|uniref:spondin domain-containing protein n=1 Tax=Actinoplanes sp. NPDC023714 TaxID=3154322 RepID=UPI0033F401DF
MSTTTAAPVTWQVRITNLTPVGNGAPGSQPLSPPVFVVHRAAVHVWREGEIASHALVAVTEDANNAVLVAAMSKLDDVVEAFASTGGPIPSGQSADFTVRVRPGLRLSIVTMLVNTNDGFTGVDSIRPQGQQFTVREDAYDSGSEVNNELAKFIPGPCCGNFFVREPEGEVIRHHEGITGRGDLDPAVHGWRDPVAEFAFTRA